MTRRVMERAGPHAIIGTTVTAPGHHAKAHRSRRSRQARSAGVRDSTPQLEALFCLLKLMHPPAVGDPCYLNAKQVAFRRLL